MISPFRIVNASAFVVQCYNELILKVEEEEKKFKKYDKFERYDI